MTRTYIAPLTFAAALAIAIGGLGLSTPADAGTRVLKQATDHTGPGLRGANKFAGSRGTSRGQIGPLDPDKFIANCHAAGGGASTDPDGFDQCTGPDGGTIPVPWEE